MTRNKTKIKTIIPIILFLALLFGFAQDDMDMEGSDEQATATEATQETPAEDVAPSVPPRGQMGSVTITSMPAKATVYLDGDEIGITPIENMQFRSGRHDMTLMLKGEELVSKRVNVWPNQSTKIHENLTMPYGSVIITTRPTRAKIYVDGQYVAKTDGGPLTINNLEEGSHSIKAVASKYRKRVQDIEIKGEDTIRVKIAIP